MNPTGTYLFQGMFCDNLVMGDKYLWNKKDFKISGLPPIYSRLEIILGMWPEWSNTTKYKVWGYLPETMRSRGSLIFDHTCDSFWNELQDQNVPLWMVTTASRTKVELWLLTLAPIICLAHSWSPISQSFDLEWYVFPSQL